MSLRSECRKSEYSSRFPRCLSILTTDAADAAWAAAWAAARAAAWAAAWDAAEAAAWDEQRTLLTRYLAGEVGPLVEASDD